MSNREDRARAALCQDVWLSIPPYLHKSIIKASIKFANAELERAAIIAEAYPETFNADSGYSAGQAVASVDIAEAIRKMMEE